MRISDWSSDVCSSDLLAEPDKPRAFFRRLAFFHAKNDVGVGQADDVLRPIVAVCFAQTCKIVEAQKESTAQAAGRLQPSLKRRQLMKRSELVKDKPGPKIPRMFERQNRFLGDIHPQI